MGIANYKFTALYVALIVAVNIAFSVTPPVILPDGTAWPPVSLIVGFVFVMRDWAQREIGHRVIGAMLVGAGLSYLLADPLVAVWSAIAFLVSEFTDWAVYSFTRRPFSERILYSSALGAPVDSAVFLGGLGWLSTTGVVAMTASKMVGALVVWWMVRRREAAGGP